MMSDEEFQVVKSSEMKVIYGDDGTSNLADDNRSVSPKCALLHEEKTEISANDQSKVQYDANDCALSSNGQQQTGTSAVSDDVIVASSSICDPFVCVALTADKPTVNQSAEIVIKSPVDRLPVPTKPETAAERIAKVFKASGRLYSTSCGNLLLTDERSKDQRQRLFAAVSRSDPPRLPSAIPSHSASISEPHRVLSGSSNQPELSVTPSKREAITSTEPEVAPVGTRSDIRVVNQPDINTAQSSELCEPATTGSIIVPLPLTFASSLCEPIDAEAEQSQNTQVFSPQLQTTPSLAHVLPTLRKLSSSTFHPVEPALGEEEEQEEACTSSVQSQQPPPLPASQLPSLVPLSKSDLRFTQSTSNMNNTTSQTPGSPAVNLAAKISTGYINQAAFRRPYACEPPRPRPGTGPLANRVKTASGGGPHTRASPSLGNGVIASTSIPGLCAAPSPSSNARFIGLPAGSNAGGESLETILMNNMLPSTSIRTGSNSTTEIDSSSSQQQQQLRNLQLLTQGTNQRWSFAASDGSARYDYLVYHRELQRRCLQLIQQKAFDKKRFEEQLDLARIEKDTADNQIRDLQSRLQDSNAENLQYRYMQQHQQQHNEGSDQQHQSQNAALLQQYSDVVVERDHLRETLQRTSAELIQTRQQFESFVSETYAVNTLNGDLKMRIDEQEQEMKRIADEYRYMRNQNEMTELRYTEKAQENNRLHRQLRDLKGQLDVTMQKDEEYRRVMQERNSVLSENERFAEQTASAKLELDDANSDRHRLHIEVDDLKQQMELLKASMPAVTATKSTGESAASSPRRQPDSVYSRGDFYDHGGGPGSSMEDGGRSLDSSGEVAMITNTSSAVIDMKMQLQNAHSELQKTQSHCTWLEKEHENALNECSGLHQMSGQYRKERDEQVMQLAEVMKELEDVKKQKQSLEREHRMLKEKQSVMQEHHSSDTTASSPNHSRDSAIDMADWEIDIQYLNISGGNKDDGDFGVDLGGGRDEPDRDGSFVPIYVKSVARGSRFENVLRVYDCLMQVNNIDVANMERRSVIDILKNSTPCKMVVKRRRLVAMKPILIPLEFSDPSEIGLSFDDGVYVCKIKPGSVSAKVGNIALGDRVVQVNGKSVSGRNAEQIYESVYHSKPQQQNDNSNNGGKSVVLALMKSPPVMTPLTPTLAFPHNFPSSASAHSNVTANSHMTDASDGKDSGISAIKSIVSQRDQGVQVEEYSSQTLTPVPPSMPLPPPPPIVKQHAFQHGSSLQHSHVGKSLFDKLKNLGKSDKKTTIKAEASIDGDLSDSSISRRHNRLRESGVRPRPVSSYDYISCSNNASGSNTTTSTITRRSVLVQGSIPEEEQQILANLDKVIDDGGATLTPQQADHLRRNFDGNQNMLSGTWPKYTVNTNGNNEMLDDDGTEFGFGPEGNMDPSRVSTSTQRHYPIVPPSTQQPKRKRQPLTNIINGPLVQSPNSGGSPGGTNVASYPKSDHGVTTSDHESPRTHHDHGTQRRGQRVDNQQQRPQYQSPRGGTTSSFSTPTHYHTSSPQQRPISFHPAMQQESHSRLYTSTPSSPSVYGSGADNRYRPTAQPSRSITTYDDSNYDRLPSSSNATTTSPRSQRSSVYSSTYESTTTGDYDYVGAGISVVTTNHTMNHQNIPGATSAIVRTKQAAMVAQSHQISDQQQQQRQQPQLHHKHQQYSAVQPYVPNSPRRPISFNSDLLHHSNLPLVIPQHRLSTAPEEYQHHPRSVQTRCIVPHSTNSAVMATMSASSRESSSSVGSSMSMGSASKHGSMGSCTRSDAYNFHAFSSLLPITRPVDNVERGERRLHIKVEPNFRGERERMGIKITEMHGNIFVTSVSGLAQKYGIRYGDQILEVRGINMRGRVTEKFATEILTTASAAARDSESEIEIVVKYNPENMRPTSTTSTPRATPSSLTKSHLSRESSVQSGLCHNHSQELLLSSSSKVPEPRHVHLPVLRSRSGNGFVLNGGNNFGIFVDQVQDKFQAETGLQTGDRVLTAEQLRAPGDLSAPVVFRDLTLEQAMNDFERLTDYPLVLNVQYDPKTLERARIGGGDLMYVKAERDCKPNNRDELSFTKGDILRIDNTAFNSVPGVWRAWLVSQQQQSSEMRTNPSDKVEKCGIINAKALRAGVYDDEHKRSQPEIFADGSSDGGSRKGTIRRSLKFMRRSSRSAGDKAIGQSPVSHQRTSSKDSEDLGYDCDVFVRVEKYNHQSRRPVVIVAPQMISDHIIGYLTNDANNLNAHYEHCIPEIISQEQPDANDQTKNDLIVVGQRDRLFEAIQLGKLESISKSNKHCLLHCPPDNDKMIAALNQNKLYPLLVVFKFKTAKQIKELLQGTGVNTNQAKKFLEENSGASQMFAGHDKMFTIVELSFGSNQDMHCGAICGILNKKVKDEQAKALWISTREPL